MSQESKLLQEILIYDHRGAVKAVAEKAVCAESTVYSNMDGKANPSVWVLKAAFLVTEDPRLKALFEPEGWELVRKAGTVRAEKSVEGEALDVVAAVGRFVETYRTAMADRMLTIKEMAELLKHIDKVELELAELKAAVKGE